MKKKKKRKVNWNMIPQEWVDKTIDKILLKYFPRFQIFSKFKLFIIKNKLINYDYT